jgi:hypothetical protein
MVLAPAINTATTGVQPKDSGVASALVSTMQQVGGSIGAAALSTIALNATTSYLAGRPASALAQAAAATHGYTVAFGVSAAVFGLGSLLTFILLPPRPRPARPMKAASPAGAMSCPASAASGG